MSTPELGECECPSKHSLTQPRRAFNGEGHPAWEAGAGPDGDEAVIDVDATIVRTRSDKQDAAPTHMRAYGHHPLVAMLAETGEVLAGMFRPGNATSGRPGSKRRPILLPSSSTIATASRLNSSVN